MDHKLQIILAAKDISGNALTKFKGSVTALTKSVFSLRGVIGTLGGTAGIGYLVKSSLEAADAIGKTADKLGLSTAALQEYQYAAEQSGRQTRNLEYGPAALYPPHGRGRARQGRVERGFRTI